MAPDHRCRPKDSTAKSCDVLAPDIINALTLKEFLPDQVELFLLGSAALGISDSVPWKAPGYFEFHGL